MGGRTRTSHRPTPLTTTRAPNKRLAPRRMTAFVCSWCRGWAIALAVRASTASTILARSRSGSKQACARTSSWGPIRPPESLARSALIPKWPNSAGADSTIRPRSSANNDRTGWREAGRQDGSMTGDDPAIVQEETGLVSRPAIMEPSLESLEHQAVARLVGGCSYVRQVRQGWAGRPVGSAVIGCGYGASRLDRRVCGGCRHLDLRGRCLGRGSAFDAAVHHSEQRDGLGIRQERARITRAGGVYPWHRNSFGLRARLGRAVRLHLAVLPSPRVRGDARGPPLCRGGLDRHARRDRGRLLEPSELL